LSPYSACSRSLIVRTDISKIKSILDCRGVVVGVLRSSQAETILTNRLQGVKVVGYPNEGCAISDLKDKRRAIRLDGQIATYSVKKLCDLENIDEFDEIN
jgi:ABC-type amino acid transport substrate-binding protein